MIVNLRNWLLGNVAISVFILDSLRDDTIVPSGLYAFLVFYIFSRWQLAIVLNS